MPRQERERRYIAEYMLDQFPLGNWKMNVEMGPIPEELIWQHGAELAAKIFRPSRPRIDAVVWTEKDYYLIEAKIREPKTGLGDLHTYGALVASTPDLPNFDGQKIILRLVVPDALEWVMIAATVQGIELVRFWRDWIAAYWKERQNYHTAAYREARDAKIQTRRILGLD